MKNQDVFFVAITVLMGFFCVLEAGAASNSFSAKSVAVPVTKPAPAPAPKPVVLPAPANAAHKARK